MGAHHREKSKHDPLAARAKGGLSSEHYHRAVAEMAYAFWEKRGQSHGSSETDWFQAEAALKPLWSADLSYASEDPTDVSQMDQPSGLSGIPSFASQSS
jgi:hypothetical protein